MYRPEITVLDCTIRDGGLINDHRFSDEFVRAIYQALCESGVDYIEMGYRANPTEFPKDKFGPWKYCEEEDLRRVTDGIETKSKISVMADVGRTVLDAIPPKSESVVDMYRVAAYVKQTDKAIHYVNHFTEKGYETTINLMATSKAGQVELEEALDQIEHECKTRAVYVVDSFGSLYSEQIHHYVAIFKKYLKHCEVGIHAHNNQQLGFANTIEAIIKGANFLDATISGIGRGAGNCPMELLIGFLKNPKFKLRPILRVLENEFLELRKEIEWGYMIPYMVTGAFDEHPRSAIALRASEDRDKYVQFFDKLLEAAATS